MATGLEIVNNVIIKLHDIDYVSCHFNSQPDIVYHSLSAITLLLLPSFCHMKFVYCRKKFLKNIIVRIKEKIGSIY